MPLEGQTPIVSYAVEANTINAGAFTINPATLSITITYELGNIKDGSL